MVTRPGRAFRPDAPPPLEVWADTTTKQGVTFRETVAPGPDREHTVARIRAHYESLASKLSSAAEELRTLVAAHEPVELLSSVVIPVSMRFHGDAGTFADSTDTVTWPAKIEYLVGVALSVPPGTASTPPEVTQRVMDLVSDVFDGVNAQQMLDSFDRPRLPNPALDEALFLLRMEHLFDRMPGYAVHLERIDAEIFDRHRDVYVDALGFNPADVARVVRRRNAAIQARADASMKRMQRLAQRDPYGTAKAMAEMLNAMTDSRTWKPDEVAADTDVDVAEVSRMLAFFATTFGAQPTFRLPSDSNLARTHPAIDLGTGAYFVPDTWTLMAAVHDRLAALAAAGAGTLRRYRKHREDGHQRLVASALRGVFPPGLVLENQHYTSETDGPGEIDVLVTTESPLVIEAKAHGLTETGRRGAPGRVKRVAGDVLDKALQQTRRAVTYILEERGRAFAAVQGGVAVDVLPQHVEDVTEIIVTFERIDPLAMAGPAIVQQAGRRVWTVGISDFLMVTDVLDEPAALHNYARARSFTAARGPLVYMESDALGAYLLDRLRTPTGQAIDEPGATVMLGYASEVINDYYTALEQGVTKPKPTTGIPSEITVAMNTAVTANSGLWIRVADAIMEASPDTWRRWRKYRKRHRSGGRFRLTPEVHLITELGGGPPLTSQDGVVALHVASTIRRTKTGG